MNLKNRFYCTKNPLPLLVLWLGVLGFPGFLLQVDAQPASAQSSSREKAVKYNPATQAKRILFLGDSITAGGHYITLVEAALRLHQVDPLPELINLGLPSETCSGLSEPDHPFPRPNVHERLDRALDRTKPDLVVACYGMNDGIYHPFSAERFKAYQEGVDLIRSKVKNSGARLILMSPPPFDPLPQQRQGKLQPASSKKFAWFAIYENYDSEVLKPYAEWIMMQEDDVEMVINLREPVVRHVRTERAQKANYVLSGDGVHLNNTGHRLLAQAILKAWNYDPDILDQAPKGYIQLVSQKQKILHDSWIDHVGHKRPSMKPGLPLPQAQAKAAELEKKIQAIPLSEGTARQDL